MTSTLSERQNEVFTEEDVRLFECRGIENLLRNLPFKKRIVTLHCFPSISTYKTNPRDRLPEEDSNPTLLFQEPEQEFALDLRKSKFNVNFFSYLFLLFNSLNSSYFNLVTILFSRLIIYGVYKAST
jgi:hypothetical protein